MKIYRYIQNYKVQILEESFVLDNEDTLASTAKISFYDINNNLIDTKKYGVVDLENIYNKILKKESIDVSKCYIKNFSLNQYRKENNLSEHNFSKLLYPNFRKHDH